MLVVRAADGLCKPEMSLNFELRSKSGSAGIFCCVPNQQQKGRRGSRGTVSVLPDLKKLPKLNQFCALGTCSKVSQTSTSRTWFMVFHPDFLILMFAITRHLVA